ncbi:TOTE conflict system archaeo-eukaryotic primase domain-containing protein [Janthinobacterium fluminis]|uniref:TOTE conflict system primase domain-containing protein n=1 Tax=Janthinobacterium fluminis TaxID=2987524 RepID=A0ABT5K7C9_9BURK|nr:hypothetical protein [Janthinobacterium fluminis]MDC8760345.1 hypothetical protein [Janthinobacterium fluminis]
MQKLISELSRLYLVDGQQYDAQGDAAPLTPAVLERHLSGEHTVAIRLATDAGLTRALVMAFDGKGGGERHWSALCAIANALQEDLGLPAPAVSISGRTAYHLWLSLEAPVPVAQAAQFLQLLRAACLPAEPGRGVAAEAAYLAVAELPPCRQASGKWAAFIHPGMGASFADDPGLDMAPPLAAQLGFLEGLRSIPIAQFAQALASLQQRQGATVAVAAPVAPAPATAAPAGLLLQDATLEDIVQFLHARNIEPTFRHILR